MIILVGSTRPAKVEGAREALVAIARVDPRFAGAQLQSYDVTAVAPRMPMSVVEIIDGARRRAEALLALARQPHLPDLAHRPDQPMFAVGLEGGLDRMAPPNDEWTLQTWAAVSDGNKWGYGAGPSISLPARVAERVAGGEELGDVIDELAGDRVRATRGAWGVLTLDLIGRRDAFRLAVVAAFAPFYNAGTWDSLRSWDSSLRGS